MTSRRDRSGLESHPFYALERMADEMDRLLDGFGFGRSPSWSRNWIARPQGTPQRLWAPAIEVYQRDHDFVVRADLPGVKKEDVTVDVTQDAITIEGSRRQEQTSESGGVYRSERSYGSFCRTIPLPEGAMTDQAKASFKDGVLEIMMPVPPEQARRGRRIEIEEQASEPATAGASGGSSTRPPADS